MFRLKSIAIVIVSVVVVVAPINHAVASIISSNDPSITPTSGHFQTGPGNITIDTLTDLAWLDLTLSTNLSYNQVVDQMASTYAGYRLASDAEILTFWNHAGIYPRYPEKVATSALQDLWGETGPWIFDDERGRYSYAFGLRATPDALVPLAQIKNYDNKSPYADIGPGGFNADYRNPAMGFALVRPVSSIVPEPGALIVWATLGLLGGFGMVRMRMHQRVSRNKSR